MRSKKTNILISAGGTGGHIFPALAIGEALRRKNIYDDLLFVGTRRGLEKRAIPPAGFRLKTIIMSGLIRSFAPADILKNLLLPFTLLIGMAQSFWILCRFRPRAVIGCGGYVTGPVVWLAAMMNRLTFVQEQNSRPGRTTIFLSRWVNRIFLAYDDARSFIAHPENALTCGNPVRAAIRKTPREEALRFFNLCSVRKTLLIVGGSLGARTINRAAMNSADVLTQTGDIQMIWQTGTMDYDTARAGIKENKNIHIAAFIDRMAEAYSAADLIICRAGAMTLAEIACYGLPAVLAPYPYAADNHQEYNAMTFVNAGAAVMIKNDELENKFLSVILPLLKDEMRLRAMSESCLRLARPDAADVIAEEIKSCLERTKKC